MTSCYLKCLRIFGSSYKGLLLNNTCKGSQIGLLRQMGTSIHNGSDRLVWIDMEMTGLDPETCHILEVACIITDGQLNVISEGPNLIIHQPDNVLESMNDWCKKHHVESGLWSASSKSKTTLAEAENSLFTFIKTHTPPGECALAGNSVYGDRMFLRKFMNRVDSYLHYRIVDVSTVKELCRRWFPSEYKNAPVKKLAHRSLDDIRESIEELRYYKGAVFNVHAEPVGSTV